MSTSRNDMEVSQVPGDQWDEARRSLAVIQRLADAIPRTREAAEHAASELGYSCAQIYVLLKRYLADPRLTSLLPRQRGPTPGFSRLTRELDQLVDELIESYYLTPQRPRIKDLIVQIRRRCHAIGLTPPSRRTITRRIRSKAPEEVTARRHGRKAARDEFGPVTGSLEAEYPLALVQIDHTLVDVIVVDSRTRRPIQRPWLTLAIDVYSRCVVGFHLTLEAPSATSVALCMAHAVLPKAQWLAQRGVTEHWPVFGLMERLLLDNAKEFRCEALRRGCEQYGICIDYRPVRTPHYGAHIERLIGTMMGKVHLLPGTTFSNVQDKGESNPDKTAAMTIEELERWLAHAIAGEYHGTEHRALATTPINAWERGICGDDTTLGRGEPRTVQDSRRLLIDFLPMERRLIRRDGVALHSIAYWSDLLRVWIGEPKKMVVRYDPRDLSRIFLLGSDGQYYDLPYRDLRRPPISLWEQRLALKRLREQGRAVIDESALFRTVDAMRAITEEAVAATKTARRLHERRLRLIPGGRNEILPEDAQVPAMAEEGARDTRQPWERMLPVEEWS